LLGGGVAFALLTSAPPGDGDSDRFDIFSGRLLARFGFEPKWSGQVAARDRQEPITGVSFSLLCYTFAME